MPPPHKTLMKRLHCLPSSIEPNTAKTAYDTSYQHILHKSAKAESAAFSCPAVPCSSMASTAVAAPAVSKALCQIKRIR